jgi:hypothetical protein
MLGVVYCEEKKKMLQSTHAPASEGDTLDRESDPFASTPLDTRSSLQQFASKAPFDGHDGTYLTKSIHESLKLIQVVHFD